MRCKDDGKNEYAAFGEEANFHPNQIKNEEEQYNGWIYETLTTYEDRNWYPCNKRTLKMFIGNEKDSYCEQASYAVGYKLGDKVIVLMELCYNTDDNRLDFIHYLQSHSPSQKLTIQ